MDSSGPFSQLSPIKSDISVFLIYLHIQTQPWNDVVSVLKLPLKEGAIFYEDFLITFTDCLDIINSCPSKFPMH